MRVYEGLIIFDSKEASTNWDSLKGQVIDILKKHECEVLRERKWSDRKLSHDIKGCKRGTYLLIHFAGPSDAIEKIRADMKLCEPVLRELIIRLNVTKEAFEQTQADEDAAVLRLEGEAPASPEAAPKAAEASGKPAEASGKPVEASGKPAKASGKPAKAGEKTEEVKV